MQQKWSQIKACTGGETISTKIYLAFIICGLLHITSGISGVVAIFLDVEGPAEENKLQGLFQSFMILTIICSTIVSLNRKITASFYSEHVANFDYLLLLRISPILRLQATKL